MAYNFYLDFITKKQGTISFRTGMSTSNEAKEIEKTYDNLLDESNVLMDEFAFPKDSVFISTTTPDYLFGFTFHYMLPVVHNLEMVPERICYPEHINYKNAVLITTPSFLEAMRKYNDYPQINPKIIITAGSKLEDKTFQYAQKMCDKVIEIYGSSETGIIAYRTSPEQKMMKLFKNVSIISTEIDGTTIKTPFSKEPVHKIGDVIKQDGNYIQLLGRADRVLKIQEKRFSASEFESEICKISSIEEVYAFKHNNKLAMLIVLSGEGKLFIKKYGTIELVKTIKQRILEKFGVSPSKIKFHNEIPKTLSGKTDRATIEDFFNLNITFPIITDKIINENSFILKMLFIPNSNFFQGHFPGFPLVPGVVQIFFANWFSKNIFGLDCKKGVIKRIKFSNIILPNKEISLEITKDDNYLMFKYYDNEKIYSQGYLPRNNVLKEKI